VCKEKGTISWNGSVTNGMKTPETWFLTHSEVVMESQRGIQFARPPSTIISFTDLEGEEGGGETVITWRLPSQKMKTS
jgi:hypothetical protein